MKRDYILIQQLKKIYNNLPNSKLYNSYDTSKIKYIDIQPLSMEKIEVIELDENPQNNETEILLDQSPFTSQNNNPMKSTVSDLLLLQPPAYITNNTKTQLLTNQLTSTNSVIPNISSKQLLPTNGNILPPSSIHPVLKVRKSDSRMKQLKFDIQQPNINTIKKDSDVLTQTTKQPSKKSNVFNIDLSLIQEKPIVIDDDNDSFIQINDKGEEVIDLSAIDQISQDDDTKTKDLIKILESEVHNYSTIH
ncbi:hypothetical protein EHI8A_158820 [Entamoeba histolytica HM-1:IMSS-B]|uniref:Uncharacterized protein n=6 Tax=Entamoeba histolytica TaxID=5759 RepID=C4LUV7_ENTH1|nr:hypothetical protein EHI_178930 [Entamoeba histolytica HM-1:IMSS]EMD43858.1 Hypothetical protein EHI5A_099020 [Entamoeba histolytica KU27]EMH74598.1 hypothetical protein EHI8A_158820 [Entamoeba histolytica HM-1:IMSS-B]EMS17617.1 hypothetical protein KM1_232990 [Entamoeba histolytica HM-3:IMSS]ENY65786.1 hypothetical protein EHI7A_141800 [Entamoeba histolytica HM-1:IMSS-A]GAT92417.1 hypothetical protein CL6EHI_178930 [Entamoeba histolytica]|eukprot:XP_649120.1 hypothetical protein EHI_178930 [Entamoeba histolytica HM-1:IMSS]